MLPLVGFQVVSASYFQAIGKPKTARTLDAVPASIASDSSGVDFAPFLRARWRLVGHANGRLWGLGADRHLLAGGATGVEGESLARATAIDLIAEVRPTPKKNEEGPHNERRASSPIRIVLPKRRYADLSHLLPMTIVEPAVKPGVSALPSPLLIS